MENLAVATYGAAIGLPFIQENAVVLHFAETTMAQHAEHGAAFNAQSEALGGARQDETNPVYTPIVEEATPTLTDALAVVNFAAVLEEVATDTYLANLSLLTTGDLRLLMGSVMGVESQHLATLRAVGALLEGCRSSRPKRSSTHHGPQQVRTRQPLSKLRSRQDRTALLASIGLGRPRPHLVQGGNERRYAGTR